MSIETMKLARQLLWRYRHETPIGNQPYMICQEVDEAFEKIDQAIEQAQKQEPLCTAAMFDDAFLAKSGLSPDTKLYTSPPQRQWVGLTDEDIDQGLLRSDYAFKTAEAWRAGVVFAMTKLKEKNT